jgi:hypothetical protein
MIQRLKNGRGAVARFGNGTVKVRPYALKTRFGGQVELTTCGKTTIGEAAGDTQKVSNKIVLDFANLESLDVLIDRLKDLRDDMANDAGV